MKTSDFDYHLPPELIAQTPIEPRDHSRLLVLHRNTGQIEHRHFHDIIRYLIPGDVLVLNESRVIPARLHGQRKSGGQVEVLLLRSQEPSLWEALVKPSKRIKAGETITVKGYNGSGAKLQVLEPVGEGLRMVRFADRHLLDSLGETPLPPYIHTRLSDPERYQTVYARTSGSVAAPTAGLHFTPALLQRVRQAGIKLVYGTLHIGLDTFRPVLVENISEHHIHTEYAELSPAAATEINEARSRGNRVVAVGTTSVRLLEEAALRAQDGRPVAPFAGPASVFIVPGHAYRSVDCMITNFHLPRSSLLMLVSAFAGHHLIMKAYEEAAHLRYRFYSFGDAMLIL